MRVLGSGIAYHDVSQRSSDTKVRFPHQDCTESDSPIWILTKLSGSAGGYGSKRSGVLDLNHSCKHRLLSTIQCINSCDNGLTVVDAVVKVAAPALVIRRALAVPREPLSRKIS
jgi:hypothetical protein